MIRVNEDLYESTRQEYGLTTKVHDMIGGDEMTTAEENELFRAPPDVVLPGDMHMPLDLISMLTCDHTRKLEMAVWSRLEDSPLLRGVSEEAISPVKAHFGSATTPEGRAGVMFRWLKRGISSPEDWTDQQFQGALDDMLALCPEAVSEIRDLLNGMFKLTGLRIVHHKTGVMPVSTESGVRVYQNTQAWIYYPQKHAAAAVTTTVVVAGRSRNSKSQQPPSSPPPPLVVMVPHSEGTLCVQSLLNLSFCHFVNHGISKNIAITSSILAHVRRVLEWWFNIHGLNEVSYLTNTNDLRLTHHVTDATAPVMPSSSSSIPVPNQSIVKIEDTGMALNGENNAPIVSKKQIQQNEVLAVKSLLQSGTTFRVNQAVCTSSLEIFNEFSSKIQTNMSQSRFRSILHVLAADAEFTMPIVVSTVEKEEEGGEDRRARLVCFQKLGGGGDSGSSSSLGLKGCVSWNISIVTSDGLIKEVSSKSNNKKRLASEAIFVAVEDNAGAVSVGAPTSQQSVVVPLDVVVEALSQQETSIVSTTSVKSSSSPSSKKQKTNTNKSDTATAPVTDDVNSESTQ
jgi:hypothetical protein